MTIRDLYPAARPSLSLNFARVKRLDPRIQFTRASSATYVDALGVWQETMLNQPRFDHNVVTGASLGLLIEEQRTNLINNPRAEAATVGVIGSGGTLPTNWQIITDAGLSYEITATGVEDGLSFVEVRHYGTPTAIAARLSFSAAITISSGVNYTGSVFIKLVAGVAIPSQFRLVMPDENGTAFLPTSTSLGKQRIVRSRVSASTSARLDIRYPLTVGVPVDFTLRYAAPQLEQGTFVTTPVFPPSGTIAASTREYELLTQTTPLVNDWLDPTQGTLLVIAQTVASGVQPLVNLEDSSEDVNGVFLQTSGTDPKLLVSSLGVTQVDLDAGTISANTRFKLAGAYAASDFATCVNYGTVVTTTSGSLPTLIDQLVIGTDFELVVPSYLNGRIQVLYVYAVKPTNTQLQSLTL